MNALTSFPLPGAAPLMELPPGFAVPPMAPAGLELLASRWAALHEAADVVALLGGVSPGDQPSAALDFPAAIVRAGGWRRDLAEHGTGDLIAIMKAGISALLAAQARGAEPTAAARALWNEFDTARAGLLALLPLPAASR